MPVVRLCHLNENPRGKHLMRLHSWLRSGIDFNMTAEVVFLDTAHVTCGMEDR